MTKIWTPRNRKGLLGFFVSDPDLKILKKRAAFVRTSFGKRHGTKGLHLQARHREDGTAHIGVGFTCSKKVGNAVARNRAKRRLREIARLGLSDIAKPGWDYVLVGRAGATATRPFDALQSDLARAIRAIHE